MSSRTSRARGHPGEPSLGPPEAGTREQASAARTRAVGRGSRSHPDERGRPLMRVEPRDGGLRPRPQDTRPYSVRTRSVTTLCARFTPRARSGRRADCGSAGIAGDTGGAASMGLRSMTRLAGNDSSWEPEGVTRQVRFGEEPGPNRRLAEISWHRRETRR